MQRFMLGAYWPARRQSLDECVDCTARFFSELVRIDPAFSHWYERSRSRKSALSKEVEVLDRNRLHDLLFIGQNKKDIGGEIIHSLGFKIGLWNGADREDEEASLSIQCGCYDERLNNSVIIDLPLSFDSLNEPNTACALLALVAKVWHPAWAGVMSKRAMRERSFNARHPFVDWLLYVPRALPNLPAPSTVETLEGLGSIVSVQPSRPTGVEAELTHIRQVEAVLAA